MPQPRTRPCVEFEGRVYSLDRDGYYKTGKTRGQKQRTLHRDIWASANGRPVPDGHHVHHRDHDRSNNDPSNLEALSASDHQSHHSRDGRGFRTWTTEQRTAARLAEWARREPTERTCPNCGGTFWSTGQRAKYCDARCRVEHNRERVRELERARYTPARRRAKYDRAQRRPDAGST